MDTLAQLQQISRTINDCKLTYVQAGDLSKVDMRMLLSYQKQAAAIYAAIQAVRGF